MVRLMLRIIAISVSSVIILAVIFSKFDITIMIYIVMLTIRVSC